jgi:hypothetical protein
MAKTRRSDAIQIFVEQLERLVATGKRPGMQRHTLVPLSGKAICVTPFRHFGEGASGEIVGGRHSLTPVPPYAAKGDAARYAAGIFLRGTVEQAQRMGFAAEKQHVRPKQIALISGMAQKKLGRSLYLGPVYICCAQRLTPRPP